jgi:hypothetical protein
MSTTQRVTTQCERNGKMRFSLDNGTNTLHDQSFTHDGREYFFLGNVFYNLEDNLVKHIFGQ